MGLIARPEEGPTPPPFWGAGNEKDQPPPHPLRLLPLRLPRIGGRGGLSRHPDTTREAAFQIGGMWCAACAWLIEHALGQDKGVERARVFFASDIVKIVYRPARVAPEALAAAIRRLGLHRRTVQRRRRPAPTARRRAPDESVCARRRRASCSPSMPGCSNCRSTPTSSSGRACPWKPFTGCPGSNCCSPCRSWPPAGRSSKRPGRAAGAARRSWKR